jgi:hypothetical protein
MSKDLSKVYTRLQKAIKINFSQPLVIDGTIESVNCDERVLVVRSLDGNNAIECRAQADLSKLKEKDRVTVKGWLKLYPNSPGKMYIATEYIYTTTEKEKYSSAIEMYNRLQKTLNTDKCQEAIKKITPLVPPQTVCNIGLIVLPDNEENLENFKIVFQEKCYGKLFIFRLKNETVESSLQTALEFFKKYHDIDLVCLLTNQLTLKHVCDLSSRENVKYMINRKKSPYIVSVTPPNKDKTVMEPLTVVLSNAKVEGNVWKEELKKAPNFCTSLWKKKRKNFLTVKCELLNWPIQELFLNLPIRPLKN